MGSVSIVGRPRIGSVSIHARPQFWGRFCSGMMLVQRGTANGMRCMRWDNDFGAARAHSAGLRAVPLPRVWQAVQRTNWWIPQSYPVSVRRHRARCLLAIALQAEPTRSTGDVPSPRYRIHLRGGSGLGGEAYAAA